jgi:hypothetical protein
MIGRVNMTPMPRAETDFAGFYWVFRARRTDPPPERLETGPFRAGSEHPTAGEPVGIDAAATASHDSCT